MQADTQWGQLILYHWFSWVWTMVYLTSDSYLPRALTYDAFRVLTRYNGSGSDCRESSYLAPRRDGVPYITVALPRESRSSQKSFSHGHAPSFPYLFQSRLDRASSKTGVGACPCSLDHFPFAVHVYAGPSVRRSLSPDTRKRVPALSDD